MRAIRRRLWALLLVASLTGATLGNAQKNAKAIYEEGKANPVDCEKARLICQAAAMDSKYAKECSEYGNPLSKAAERNLKNASDKLDNDKLESAKATAGYVCEITPEVKQNKQDLLARIDKAIKARDEKEVAAKAPAVATPVAVPAPVTTAQVETRPQEPVRQAPTPVIPPPPPVEVAASKPVPSAAPVQQTPKPGPVRDREAETRSQVASLLERGRKQLSAGDLPTAQSLLGEAHRLQPENIEVGLVLKDVQDRISSRPDEQAKVLKAAIRAFYDSNYPGAKDSLEEYLQYRDPKYKGAAQFYLGAARLYDTVLGASGRRPEDAVRSDSVQSRFKEARAACYQPVEKLISPMLRNAWDLSRDSAKCST